MSAVRWHYAAFGAWVQKLLWGGGRGGTPGKVREGDEWMDAGSVCDARYGFGWPRRPHPHSLSLHTGNLCVGLRQTMLGAAYLLRYTFGAPFDLTLATQGIVPAVVRQDTVRVVILNVYTEQASLGGAQEAAARGGKGGACELGGLPQPTFKPSCVCVRVCVCVCVCARARAADHALSVMGGEGCGKGGSQTNSNSKCRYCTAPGTASTV